MILDERLDHSWRERAVCTDADTELFYPPRDKLLYSKIAAKAKRYCNGTKDSSPCPVRADCLWQAIITDEQHGIWGGLSHRERNALVRKWQREYRGKMTLKEYIFKEREEPNGGSKI